MAKKTATFVGGYYSPHLFDKWDATVEYEQLSNVPDEYGNSYTAKKRVPIGTPLTNTEYWRKDGNYNAQMEKAQRDISNLNANKVNKTDYDTKTAKIQNDIDTLNRTKANKDEVTNVLTSSLYSLTTSNCSYLLSSNSLYLFLISSRFLS